MATPSPNRAGPATVRLQRRNRNVDDINQFGAVRDRLFHAMLVKVTISYCKHVNPFFRRVIEFVSLILALLMLGFLFFIHVMSSRASPTCLDSIKSSWPRDGVVRVEVVKHLDNLEYKEKWISWFRGEKARLQCHFSPKHVLMYGPRAMPAEIRQGGKNHQAVSNNPSQSKEGYKPLLLYILNLSSSMIGLDEDDEEEQEMYHLASLDDEAERSFNDHFLSQKEEDELPSVLYRVEYALHYGLLRLSMNYREHHNIPYLPIRIDSEDKCFGDFPMRFTLNNILGFEEAVMTSLRSLAVNETTDGYLHNLDTSEHYHFVGHGMTKKSYITAAVVMFIFTFAISLLLRFSHHQIFMFIVDLLHMFELNQPLEFPAAPLLTVILALVGMEAIMSEVFADTSTAFYVILVVWIADQFDAICCHSPTSKQYWLRFFYLYQFFFYAYQYRFGGQFGGVALITSALFILHSMIFFFHHYEMPLILYQERVLRILSEIHSASPMVPSPNTQPRSDNAGQEADVNHANGNSESLNNMNSSSVFDGQNPSNGTEQANLTDYATAPREQAMSTEERVAQNLVSDTLEELFNS